MVQAMESRFLKQGKCCVLLSRKYADMLDQAVKAESGKITKVSIVEKALDLLFKQGENYQ